MAGYHHTRLERRTLLSVFPLRRQQIADDDRLAFDEPALFGCLLRWAERRYTPRDSNSRYQPGCVA